MSKTFRARRSQWDDDYSDYDNPRRINKFKKIIVCELNDGQFAKVLNINFNGFEFIQFNKIQGLPFGKQELIQKFNQLVK